MLADVRSSTSGAVRWSLLAAVAWCSLVGTVVAQAPDYSAQGDFSGGRMKVTVPRADGSTFDAWMYYPATRNGLNAPADVSGGSYPLVTFGHPFILGPPFNNSTLQHLASWGYVVIAPATELGFLPSHPNFANDIKTGIDYLQSLNTNPASPFAGHLDVNSVGASGYSMGGGASILATAQDPRIDALVNMAAAQTFPISAIDSMAQIDVPVRLIAGTNDQIAPISRHQGPMYDNGNAPVQLRAIVGGNHMQFQDFPLTDPNSISQDAQLALSRSEITSWFELYLKQDQAAWRSVWGPEAVSDPTFQSSLNSGILVEQLSASTGPTPDTILYQMSVTNTGSVPNGFDLFVEDNQFSSVLSISSTPQLGPGQSASFSLLVTLPGGTLGDSALVSARSQNDGGTRGWTFVQTSQGAVPTPEPATWALSAVGLACLGLLSRRRRA